MLYGAWVVGALADILVRLCDAGPHGLGRGFRLGRRLASGMSSKWLYIAARDRQDRETGGFRAPIEGRRVGSTEADSVRLFL